MNRKQFGISALGVATLFSAMGVASQADAATTLSVYGGATDGGNTATSEKAYGISSEAYDGTALAVAGDISNLVMTTGSDNPSKIVLTISNGTFDTTNSGSIFPMVWTPANANDTTITATTDPATSELQFLANESGSVVSCTATSTTITCRPTGLGTVPMGMLDAGVSDTDVGGGDDGANNLDAGSKIVFVAIANVGGGNDTANLDFADVAYAAGVTIDTTATSLSSGSSISMTAIETNSSTGATTSDSTNVATIQAQYGFCVTTDLDGTINLNADPIASSFTGTVVTDNAGVEYQNYDTLADSTCSATSSNTNFLVSADYATGDGNQFTVVLTPSTKSGISAVAAGTNDTTVSLAYVSSIAGFRSTAVDFVDLQGETFKVTVDGSTSLVERTFTISISGVDETSTNVTTYLTDEDAGSWSYNGYSAYIPHVVTNYSTLSAFVKVTNNSSVDAEVYAGGSVKASATGAFSTQDTTLIGTVGAGESLIITGSTLDDYFTSTMTDTSATYQTDLTVSVAAPEDEVIVSGYTSTSTGGRTFMAVYPSSDTALHQ